MTLVLEFEWSAAHTTVRVHDRATAQVVVEAASEHLSSDPDQHDPATWWSATRAATADALAGMAAMGLPTDEFASILVTVGDPPGGLVVLDHRGDVVRPALLGSHTASAADADWLCSHAPGGADSWIDATGGPPTAGSTVALLSWLHRSDPEAWRRLQRVTLPTGWLVERLTGEARLGAHDAIGTGVVDRRDPSRWRTDLLRVVDPERDWALALPHLVVPADAAEASSLRPPRRSASARRCPCTPAAPAGAERRRTPTGRHPPFVSTGFSCGLRSRRDEGMDVGATVLTSTRAGRLRARRCATRGRAVSEVVFDEVTKRFGDVTAVSRLTLSIADGEFMVLLGPSGCGKTTALRMIAGLETVTEGTLRIGDRVVNDVEAKDRDISMVFQSYALYPHMTVAKNVESPLVARKFHVDGEDEPRKLHAAERKERIAEATGGPRPHRPARPQARGALGRSAPARRPGPGHRRPPVGVPDGRAAVEPRRQAPGPDPPRARRAPEATRHHLRLRHPRPGRGHDHGRPHRHHQRRRAPTGRTAPGRVRPPREPLRGPLHRIATHEHGARPGGGRRRRHVRRPGRPTDLRGTARRPNPSSTARPS